MADRGMITAGPDITCIAVAKTFGDGSDAVQAVAPLTLTLGAGQMTALVGPSGCGKSTLLRMIAGLEAPSDGDILLGGQTPRQMQAQGAMAMAFQDASLLPGRSVRSNVALARSLARLPSDDRAVMDMIARVGLAGFENARAAECGTAPLVAGETNDHGNGHAFGARSGAAGRPDHCVF